MLLIARYFKALLLPSLILFMSQPFVAQSIVCSSVSKNQKRKSLLPVVSVEKHQTVKKISIYRSPKIIFEFDFLTWSKCINYGIKFHLGGGNASYMVFSLYAMIFL